MARDHLDNCPRCSADLMFDGSSTLVKCKSCGETIKVADFLNEEIRLEQAQQEAAEAQKALEAAKQEKAAALEEKKEAEQRVFRAITQLEDISISQSEQKESLEKLLSGQEASKTEAKALHQLLDALYGQQETHQDALTELLSAVLQGQETTDDKLKVLQEISEKLLQSQNDIISLAGYLKTDTRETNRLIGQMFSWSQNTNQETTRRLKAMQSGSEALQNSLKDIDKKIDRLDSSIANVSSQITDFESSWKESELKKITSLYHQAENKQKSRDFDKAEGYYRNVLTSGGEDPEVYWRLILCHYCVEYQQDDHGKWLPTILYPSLDEPRTLPEWEDLQKKCADSPELLKHYEKLLIPIEQIIQRYCQLRQSVTPQVFICVKQEENSHRTVDSDTGSDLYDLIRGKGLSVFNSRRTQIPAGEMYEPYIIAALLSARLMIVVGTTPDHMEARWVKNEWTRFQWLQDKETKQTNKTDRRLVCYLKGMKPKDIPGGLHPNIQAIEENANATTALEKLLNMIFLPTPPVVPPPATDTFDEICDQMEIWLAIGAYERVNQKYVDLVDLKKYTNEPRLHLYGLCAIKEAAGFEQLAALEIRLEKESLFKLARKKAVTDEDKKLIGELLRINAEHNLPPSPPPRPESDEVRQLRTKAENGDVASQLRLARCCEAGNGTEQSFTEAFRWYQIAAEANNASAQCNLGWYYSNGQGVKQDYGKALFWFQKSAEQGDAYGQANLGVMYENGHGVSKDYSKAAEWYRKGADQNHAGARRNLGRLYENGLGVEQDYEKAALWYRKAADQGDEKARTFLINLEKKIEKLKRMPPVIKSLEIDSREGRLDHYLKNNHLSKDWIRNPDWPDTLVFIRDFVSRLSVQASYEKPLEAGREEIIWQILTEDNKPFTPEIRESHTIQPGSTQSSLCLWDYSGTEEIPAGTYSIVITVNGSKPFFQRFRMVGLSELKRPGKGQKPKEEQKREGSYSNPRTGYEKDIVGDSGAARKWTVPPQTDDKQKTQSGFDLKNIHVFEADDRFTGIYHSNLFIQRSIRQLGIQFDIDHVDHPEYAAFKWKVVRQDGYTLIPETTGKVTLKKGDTWIRQTKRLFNINAFRAGSYQVTASCNGRELTTAFTVVDPQAQKWQKEKAQIQSATAKLLIGNAGSENMSVALPLSRKNAIQIGVRVFFLKPSIGSDMLISWFIEKDNGERVFSRINAIKKVPRGATSFDHILTPAESQNLLRGFQNGAYKIRVCLNGERPVVESFKVKD